MVLSIKAVSGRILDYSTIQRINMSRYHWTSQVVDVLTFYVCQKLKLNGCLVTSMELSVHKFAFRIVSHSIFSAWRQHLLSEVNNGSCLLGFGIWSIRLHSQVPPLMVCEFHTFDWHYTRDVTEPANIRIRRMRICRAIKITSYYSYCNWT